MINRQGGKSAGVLEPSLGAKCQAGLHRGHGRQCTAFKDLASLGKATLSFSAELRYGHVHCLADETWA